MTKEVFTKKWWPKWLKEIHFAPIFFGAPIAMMLFYDSFLSNHFKDWEIQILQICLTLFGVLIVVTNTPKKLSVSAPERVVRRCLNGGFIYLLVYFLCRQEQLPLLIVVVTMVMVPSILLILHAAWGGIKCRPKLSRFRRYRG